MPYEQFGDHCPCAKKRKLYHVGRCMTTMKGGKCLSMNGPQGLTDLHSLWDELSLNKAADLERSARGLDRNELLTVATWVGVLDPFMCTKEYSRR